MYQKFEMQLTLSGNPSSLTGSCWDSYQVIYSTFTRVFDRPVAFTDFWVSTGINQRLSFSAPETCYCELKESRGCQVLLTCLWPLWDALSKNPGWMPALNNSNNRSVGYTVGWSIAICYIFTGQVNERKIGNDYSAGAWINLSPFSMRPGNIRLLQIIFN